MLARNSSGLRVSLLNDFDSPAASSTATSTTNTSSTSLSTSSLSSASNASLTRKRLTDHSRASSYSSQTLPDDLANFRFGSSKPSPQLRPSHPPSYPSRPPQLIRNASTSSSCETLDSPSPMTPEYSFDPMDQQNKNAFQTDLYYRATTAPYFPTTQASLPLQQAQIPLPMLAQQTFPAFQNEVLMEEAYPPLIAPTTQFSPYTTDLITPITPQSAFPLNSSTTGAPATAASQNTSSTSSSAAQSKVVKKKYPCPHAARFSCTDTFTTSGHAARHGKKHTGEKNIFCPTCNKAFTRKDNMKQHERTHKSGEKTNGTTTASLSTSGSSGHHSTSTKESSVTPSDLSASIPNTPSMLAKTHQLSSEGSSLSASSSSRINNSSLSIDTSRPTLDRQFSTGSLDGEGESPGLDALAMAASGMQ